MNFFFDSNVILNFLLTANVKHKESSILVRKVFAKEIKGFVSAHSLCDIFYILRKYLSLEDRRQFLLSIIYNFQIISEDKQDFLDILTDANFFDLEDGLQIKCAEKTDLDYIITENLKDFKNSQIPVLSVDDTLKLLSN